MRRAALALLLAVLPLPALANPFAGHIGIGGVAGPMRWDAPGDDFTDTLLAASIGAGGTLARRLTPRFALGLGVDFWGLVVGKAELDHTRFGPGYHASFWIRGIHRPSRDAVLRFGGGFTFAGFGGSTDEGFGKLKHEDVLGPSLEVSAGYGHWALCLSAGYLISQHLKYTPVSLSLRYHFGEH